MKSKLDFRLGRGDKLARQVGFSLYQSGQSGHDFEYHNLVDRLIDRVGQ